MSMTKLFHVIGKLLSFCMTAGFFVVHAMKAKRMHRNSWFKRTRFAGLFERIRTIFKGVIVAALIVLALHHWQQEFFKKAMFGPPR